MNDTLSPVVHVPANRSLEYSVCGLHWTTKPFLLVKKDRPATCPKCLEAVKKVIL